MLPFKKHLSENIFFRYFSSKNASIKGLFKNFLRKIIEKIWISYKHFLKGNKSIKNTWLTMLRNEQKCPKDKMNNGFYVFIPLHWQSIFHSTKILSAQVLIQSTIFLVIKLSFLIYQSGAVAIWHQKIKEVTRNYHLYRD